MDKEKPYKKTMYKQFVFLSLTIIALVGLIFNKNLYLIWGVLLGISFAGIVYSLIKVNKGAKFIASIIAFIIGISFSFLSSSVSKNNIAQGNFELSDQIFSTSTSFTNSSSKIRFLDQNIINYNYNVSPEAPKNENMDLTIEKTNKALEGITDSSKNIKSFRVLEVYSPSTIEIEHVGLVQLLGVQNPDFNPKTSCLQDTAYEKLNEILVGRSVYLEFDSSAKFDKNGRVLAYVYLQSNYFVNLKLIEEGLAYNLDESISNHYKYTEFKNVETEARLIPSGVWVNNVCGNDNVSSSGISSVSSSSRSSITQQLQPVLSSSKSSVSNPVVNSSSSSISSFSSDSKSSINSVSSSSSNSTSSITISSSSNSSSINSSVSVSSASSISAISRIYGGWVNGVYVCNTNFSDDMDSKTVINFKSLEECLSIAGSNRMSLQ